MGGEGIPQTPKSQEGDAIAHGAKAVEAVTICEECRGVVVSRYVCSYCSALLVY